MILQFKGISTYQNISSREGGVERDQRNETNWIFGRLWIRDLIQREQEVLTSVKPFSFLRLFSQTKNLRKRPYLKLSLNV